MANYKPIDLAKEDFRKYLDRQGVLDAITKVLVKCNTERPEHALGFVVDTLNETHGNLKTQLHEAHQEIERLKKELSALKVEDKTVKPSTIPSVSALKQEAEIVAASESNEVTIKQEGDDNVGEAAANAAVDVKQERDGVMPSTSAVDMKPKETPAASTAKEEVPENAVTTASAASSNDAPDAKEPSTSESSK